MPADPLASLLIGVLILWSSIGLLRRTLAILIHATPAHLDFHEIQAALEVESRTWPPSTTCTSGR